MKCVHCQTDSKYKDRSSGRCPSCGKAFAFEPKQGDPFTDMAFQSAIDAVSAKGAVRWGVEHLYYEVCRRRRGKRFPWKVCVALVIALLVLLNWTNAAPPLFVLVPAVPVIWLLIRRLDRLTPTVQLERAEFDRLWQKWVSANGNPKGLIVRKTQPRSTTPQERDIGDYSFDRAVICDRARTVDLLIANNFHFENNCAVLSVRGYPEGPFETVRTMLKRNPKLQVFALHDASITGCRLANTLADDPAWFKGQVTVTDVGLRPRHAAPFHGLLLPAAGAAVVVHGTGIDASEVAFLTAYVLELAAIRPEQILKRLFRAINRREDIRSDSDGSSGSDGSGIDDDRSSFSQDAGDSDNGSDSFG